MTRPWIVLSNMCLCLQEIRSACLQHSINKCRFLVIKVYLHEPENKTNTGCTYPAVHNCFRLLGDQDINRHSGCLAGWLRRQCGQWNTVPRRMRSVSLRIYILAGVQTSKNLTISFLYYERRRFLPCKRTIDINCEWDNVRGLRNFKYVILTLAAERQTNEEIESPRKRKKLECIWWAQTTYQNLWREAHKY